MNRYLVRIDDTQKAIVDNDDKCVALITNYQYEYFCSECGRPTKLMGSYETGYNERTVYNKCTCGNTVIYRG